MNGPVECPSSKEREGLPGTGDEVPPPPPFKHVNCPLRCPFRAQTDQMTLWGLFQRARGGGIHVPVKAKAALQCPAGGSFPWGGAAVPPRRSQLPSRGQFSGQLSARGSNNGESSRHSQPALQPRAFHANGILSAGAVRQRSGLQGGVPHPHGGPRRGRRGGRSVGDADAGRIMEHEPDSFSSAQSHTLPD